MKYIDVHMSHALCCFTTSKPYSLFMWLGPLTWVKIDGLSPRSMSTASLMVWWSIISRSPQENNNYKLMTDSFKRESCSQRLQAATPQVVQFLLNLQCPTVQARRKAPRPEHAPAFGFVVLFTDNSCSAALLLVYRFDQIVVLGIAAAAIWLVVSWQSFSIQSVYSAMFDKAVLRLTGEQTLTWDGLQPNWERYQSVSKTHRSRCGTWYHMILYIYIHI